LRNSETWEKYQELVSLVKLRAMAKNTSILLGDYFDNFISKQIQNGRFSSASEVVRAVLRLFEQEENQKKELIKELRIGEKSGFVPKFDRKKFVSALHKKHVTNGL
jgi:antitoxin ParD1/3/4